MTTKVSDLLTRWLTYELQSRTGFRWDASVGRYRDKATGRLVSERAVFNAADGFREMTRQNIQQHTQRFLDGQIELADWQRRVAGEVRDSRMVAYMAARGGKNAMTQADYGRIGGRLSNDFRHLDTFAQEIKVGMLSPAQIKARADLYGEVTIQSYNDGTVAAHRETLLNLKWVVGPTEHCSDCLRLNGQVHPPDVWAASGWQPQARVLECGGFRCQCSFVPTDEEESGGF